MNQPGDVLTELVGMSLEPMVDDHHVPTLQEVTDSDYASELPSGDCSPSSSCVEQFSSGVLTLICFICFAFLLNIFCIVVGLMNYANGGILLPYAG